MAEEARKRKIPYYCGPVAQRAHESSARVKLVWGPLGTAKTSYLCWRVWFKAMRAGHQGYSLKAIIVRDTYRNLEDSTLDTFLYWFPEADEIGPGVGQKTQSKPVDYRIFVNGQFHTIKFRHGQTEQDASMFLSTEFDLIDLEEVAPAYIPGMKKISPGISEGVFDMAYSRLTRQKDRAEAIGPELNISCNPPPLPHWASKRIIDMPREYLQRNNWEHFYFPIEDNARNLREDYYTSLESAWEGKRALVQRFIQGKRLPVFIGIPRFNLDQLDRMNQVAVEPDFKGFLKDTDENPLHVELEGNPNGYVKIWDPPKFDEPYVIFGDVAEGLEGGDFSAAYVINSITLDIVAAWHGHIEPEGYGDELARLGYLYNKARIGVESNNHGLTTLVRLKNLNYPKIHYQKSQELRGRGQERLGLRTDTKTKPMLVNSIGAHLDIDKDDPGVKDPYIPDEHLISELQTFGVMDNGKCAAQAGCFDDRVIAYGGALLMTKISGLDSIYPH